MKPFNEHEKAVDKEAQKRADQINKAGDEVLDLLVKYDLTVNDMQVILNQLTQNLAVVFQSRKISTFIDKKAE